MLCFCFGLVYLSISRITAKVVGEFWARNSWIRFCGSSACVCEVVCIQNIFQHILVWKQLKFVTEYCGWKTCDVGFWLKIFNSVELGIHNQKFCTFFLKIWLVVLIFFVFSLRCFMPLQPMLHQWHCVFAFSVVDSVPWQIYFFASQEYRMDIDKIHGR